MPTKSTLIQLQRPQSLPSQPCKNSYYLLRPPIKPTSPISHISLITITIIKNMNTAIRPQNLPLNPVPQMMTYTTARIKLLTIINFIIITSTATCSNKIYSTSKIYLLLSIPAIINHFFQIISCIIISQLILFLLLNLTSLIILLLSNPLSSNPLLIAVIYLLI